MRRGGAAPPHRTRRAAIASNDVVSPPSTSVALAAPVTPDYGPRVGAAPPIYRCRVGGATVYSNQPCTGARLVDESSAVDGFDSRPSDRLARLVADGQDRADGGAATGPVASAASNTGALSVSSECATLRRQIRDLDDATRMPHDSSRVLDGLRAVRQDVMTSIARLHC